VKLGRLASAVADQVASNASAIGHEASFLEHRARLTREIVQRAPVSGGGRLCLLGAGNANDVDLDALAARYAEIHLVDIDPAAVARAIARLPPERRGQIVPQAPLDASGLFDRLETWTQPSAALLTPEAIDGIVADAVDRVAGALPAPFDVVASCGMLTQLQLVLLQVVGDDHPRFAELRTAVNRAHVRTLGALLAPGGVALLITDLTTSEIFPPLIHVGADEDLAKLMSDLISTGSIIYIANPGTLSSELRRDPALKLAFGVRYPIGPWIWRNGPTQVLLVYALEIRRNG
jgi:SAM-dependent methyltransferase